MLRKETQPKPAQVPFISYFGESVTLLNHEWKCEILRTHRQHESQMEQWWQRWGRPWPLPKMVGEGFRSPELITAPLPNLRVTSAVKKVSQGWTDHEKFLLQVLSSTLLGCIRSCDSHSGASETGAAAFLWWALLELALHISLISTSPLGT